jgi:hypothetical protein
MARRTPVVSFGPFFHILPPRPDFIPAKVGGPQPQAFAGLPDAKMTVSLL